MKYILNISSLTDGRSKDRITDCLMVVGLEK